MGNENDKSTKQKVLSALRNSPAPVSGEELAASCGVTRVSVWKAIQKLQEAGYGITGGRTGYQLTVDKQDSLDPWEFGQAEKQFLHFHQTESTMIEARRIAETAAEAGTDHQGSRLQVITADTQTAGRGRADRNWTTTNGSLAYTIVTDTRLNVAETHRAIMVSQLAVLRTLQDANPSKEFYLRWPNDVWCRNGKVCGILDEFRATGSFTRWLNLGIGINLHAAPEGAGCVFDRPLTDGAEGTRRAILESYLQHWQKLSPLAADTTGDLAGLWNSACIDVGSMIRLDDGNRCRFLGINGYGWATVETESGTKLYPPGTARYIK